MSDAAKISGATSPTIGVFDSGFGGLTVLRALMAQLPLARFAFFGDTARLPYGSKSRRTIARYAVQCAQFLVSQQGDKYQPNRRCGKAPWSCTTRLTSTSPSIPSSTSCAT